MSKIVIKQIVSGVNMADKLATQINEICKNEHLQLIGITYVDKWSGLIALNESETRLVFYVSFRKSGEEIIET
jgi:hypothetical protein